MSYISAIKQKDTVTVWERNGDVRDVVQYPAPYYFFTEDSTGEYKSIYGQKLIKHEFSTGNDMYLAKQQLLGHRVRLYESDIQPEVKILSQHYYNATIPKLNITFLDIEVDYNPEVGFSSIANPYAPINAIAIHHAWNNRSIVYTVPPPGWNMDDFDKSLLELSEVVFCKNESELLAYILVEIEDSDVLSGWNSDFFDMPYIAKRIEMKLGKSYLRKLSFPGAEMPKYREVEVFGQQQILLELSGRVSLDYMQLFKKYEMNLRASYKLEAISEEFLPHLPKLEYEGSLAGLYVNNFNHFIRYNIRDTEILRGFEDKLGYVALANVMCHTSTAQFKHVFGTLQLTDLAIVNYCHYDLDVKVPDWWEKPDGSIQGAYVLFPQIGMHDWIGSIDINSLYPSSIRSINISPETIIGQFDDKIKAWEEVAKGSAVKLTVQYDTGESEENTADEWRNTLKSRGWSISGYGTIFDQNTPGIVPIILASWYKKRKEYQKLKNDLYEQAQAAKKAGDEIAYAELLDKSTYYDRLQYVYKIKLNSAYGALTNYHFRFFDLRMGESTTGTGRAILKHQAKMVSKLLDGNYNVDFPLYGTVKEATHPDKGGLAHEALDGPVFKNQVQSESVIYGDTDSVYFKTHAQDKEEAILVADTVANKVNASFQQFMQEAFLCRPGFDDIIKCGREVVSDRGIFVDKKRYVLHLVDLDGHSVDKLKTMGLEMKKTTTPKPIQKFLENTIMMILADKSRADIEQYIITFRDDVVEKLDVFDIGLPKGVKKVEEYTQQYKIYGEGTRLPGHVSASIHYNECLEEFRDKESPIIVSNTKIKVFYLTQKCGKFKSIALPTDIEIVPAWFTEHFKVDRALHAEKLIDNNLAHIFDAIKQEVPTRQTVLTNDLLTF